MRCLSRWWRVLVRSPFGVVDSRRCRPKSLHRCVRPRCLRPAAGAVAQVNVAFSPLDQMAQKNAAMVEQIAAAVCGLQQEALRLREAIDAFA